jgi:pimeloyl-ACP methyl ester carboxylesterase
VSKRQQVRAAHSVEVRQVYERVLAGSSVRSRYLETGAGGRVHLLEIGAGPPVVLVHGTGSPAGFFLPLLRELDVVRAFAPDRPGKGLSDPIDLPRHRYRENAVAWLDHILDALELDSAALLGHSAGGVWSLWYALAHPDRVRRLVLIGPPAFPRTRCPLPYRLMATPGLGELLSRLVPASPKSLLRFASFMGEGETLPGHPDLIDLLVAAGRDSLAVSVDREEARVLVSPFALLSPSGFRRQSRVRGDELRQVAMPTLVVWGDREPLGSVSVAKEVTELIPRARLEVLAGGHAPWLGQPAQIAATIADFVR